MNKFLLIFIALATLVACKKKDKEEEPTPDTWEETTKVATPHLERVTVTTTGDTSTFMEFNVDGNKDLTAVRIGQAGTLYDFVFENFIKDKNGRVTVVTGRIALATEGMQITLGYDQKGRIISANHVTTTINYVYDAQDRIIERNNSSQKITYYYSGTNKMPDSTESTISGDPSVFTDVYTYGNGIAPFSTLPPLVVFLHFEQLSYNHIGYDVTSIVNKKDGVVNSTVNYTNTYDAAGRLKTRSAVGMGLTYEYHYAQ